MDVTIKVSRLPNTIEKACRQAIKHHLYQHEIWLFYKLFREYPHSILKMATAYHEGKRVGVCVYWDNNLLDYGETFRQIGCYVPPEYRRKGIGSKMVARMKVPDDVRMGTGILGSENFWSKNRPNSRFTSWDF